MTRDLDSATVAEEATAILARAYDAIRRDTDRIFATLMVLQWLSAVGLAWILAPRTWSGAQSAVHPHVWMALALGGLLAAAPLALARALPGRPLTRHVIAACQVLMSGVLIHVTGGRIETHFHVFVSLALLAFYRDGRVLLSASAVVAVEHILRGFYWPATIFGTTVVYPWRWLEHTAWVTFEDACLVVAIVRTGREMQAGALRQARLQAAETALRSSHDALEGRVEERTEELRRQRELLRRVLDTDPNLIFIKDERGVFLLVNQAMADLYSTRADAMTGKRDADFNGRAEEVDRFLRDDWEVIESGRDKFVSEESVTDASGRRRWFQTVKRPLPSPDGAIRHLLGIGTDITARKEAEERLIHQAFHDTLTDLPNRALFLDRVERGLARAVRTGASLAVLFIDLDNFKFVNDSLGHDVGDELLRVVGRRLQECIRPGDTVARMGGDEFTLLLEDVAGEEEVRAIAGRISERLRDPHGFVGREVFPGASIGMTLTEPGESRSAGDLLRDADTAMYQAKNGGKGRCTLFDPSMYAHALERLELETDLRRALEKAEFVLYYQPVVGLETGQVLEVEALVRWLHPRHGLIPPAAFIPVAEETGLIVRLGYWILERACEQGRQWRDTFPSAERLTMSVNLSIRQLLDSDLVERVSEILDRTGMDPTCLKLEITESIMLSETESTVAKMRALRRLGIRLAVDDFGTGYSSMAYLSELPLDTLKIDRSFVERMGNSHEDEAIVRAIIGLARNLNLSVTCEGIETKEQLSSLRILGCDSGQGYLLHHPLSQQAMEALLEAAQPARIAA